MWHDSVCNTVQEPTVTSTIVAKKTTTWGESGFPSEFLGRLRVGKWVTGAISNETGRPGDPFTVDLVQGRRYRIDLEGTATGRGSMPDPLLSNVYYIVGSALPQAPESYDNDSGKGGVNAQITFTAEVTATYYILANGNNSQGTYRLTVQEIVDDLGLWYTDWGAEKLGGFLRPSQEATGNLYGPHIIERSGGQRDKDGFLFYLGSDEAPMNSDYILTIRGQNAPRLQVQTFYDLSNLDDYIENFSLDPKFIEFPGTEYGNPDPDLSDAEAGRTGPLSHGQWARCWAPARRESTTWSSTQVERTSAPTWPPSRATGSMTPAATGSCCAATPACRNRRAKTSELWIGTPRDTCESASR